MSGIFDTLAALKVTGLNLFRKKNTEPLPWQGGRHRPERYRTAFAMQYGSIFFIITGTHLAHVCVGIIVLALLLIWTLMGYFDSRTQNVFSVGAIYWHFVDVVWLFIFSSLYLSPHLGLAHGV